MAVRHDGAARRREPRLVVVQEGHAFGVRLLAAGAVPPPCRAAEDCSSLQAAAAAGGGGAVERDAQHGSARTLRWR